MKKAPFFVIGIIVIGVALILISRSGSSPSISELQSGDAELADIKGGSELIDDDVVLGDPDAPLTLVEFGDYQCSFCTRFFFETKPTLEEEYVKTGKLKIVFRDFAINGNESVNAAEASQCAADQGGFWDYHNKLYEERQGYNVGVFNEDNLVRFAGEVGLDEEQFRTCYQNDTYRDEVRADAQDAQLAGARGTPTFFLNGFLIPGAQPLSFFEQSIEQLLAAIEQEAPENSSIDLHGTDDSLVNVKGGE